MPNAEFFHLPKTCPLNFILQKGKKFPCCTAWGRLHFEVLVTGFNPSVCSISLFFATKSQIFCLYRLLKGVIPYFHTKGCCLQHEVHLKSQVQPFIACPTWWLENGVHFCNRATLQIVKEKKKRRNIT